MNPDVILSTTYLETITETPFRKEVGMVTGKILRMPKGLHHKAVIDSTGIRVDYSRSMHDIGEGEEDIGQYNKTVRRKAVSCCCALLRREMLTDICQDGQYFDESLYMYLEDVDLCWRAFLKGWEGLYVHGAIAYHKRGGTRKSGDASFFRKLNLHNRYIVLCKNDSFLLMLAHFPFILVYEVLLFWRVFRYPYLLAVYPQTIRYLLKNMGYAVRSKATRRRKMEFLDWDFRFIWGRLRRTIRHKEEQTQEISRLA